MTRLRKSELRQLVNRTVAELREASGDAPPEQKNLLEDDSVDSKLDGFFVDAEKPDEMQESIARFVSNLLSEADEDEESAQAEPADSGSDDSQQEAPPEQDDKPVLDVHRFSSEVARVIENLQKLVDLNAIVLRRALNYVTSHYDEATTKQVQDILEHDHNISLERKDPDYDNVSPPGDHVGPNVT